MTRFSTSTRGSSKTLNRENAPAYKDSPKMELYSMVVTSVFHNQFYRDSKEYITRLRELIKKVPGDFVLKLAIYTREKMYLRTIPLILLVESLSLRIKGTRAAITRTIKRADELYEILGYYKESNNIKEGISKLSHALSRGVAGAFHKFDEYQFGKYNRDVYPGLRDAMFLTHPKPIDATERELFKKIAEDKLEVPYTWETQLSEHGNTKEVWEGLIDSGKLPYMACLRNLRNILNAKVSGEHITKVANQIGNTENVLRSKQFPFRFLSAYRELKGGESFNTPTILEALNKAIAASADNIPIHDGENVVIACDVSGSMRNTISPRSKVMHYDIGLTLGTVLAQKCPNVVTGIFGDQWKILQIPKGNVLQSIDQMDNLGNTIGWSTEGWKVVDWILKSGQKVDKLFFFTDSQMYSRFRWSTTGEKQFSGSASQVMKSWSAVKAANPDAKVYFFDLAGYGDTPIHIDERGAYKIAGWSDKVFTVLSRLEEGGNALDEIDSIAI